MTLQEADRQYIWHPFAPLRSPHPQLLITSGEGVYLHTEDGRKILDAVSSWWVNLHGHSNPVIAKAIATQAQQLEHVIFAGFTHKPAIELAESIVSLLPEKEKIFFSDNGSTAVEVALKMAIQFWYNQGEKNKTKIIALQGAYHGDTFGAMAAGERNLFTKPFHDRLFTVEHIPLPDETESTEAFEKAISQNDVAAFIYEPLVQGAAGMNIYSASWLDRVLHLAKEKQIITIADEVFTGFYRTGKFWASHYLHHQADITTLSKGITGGFIALGVTACSSKIVHSFDDPGYDKTFFHGHSYTGNPLACAAANASLSLTLSEKCKEQVAMITHCHQAFAERIRHYNKVKKVQSLGTIFSLELLSSGGYTDRIRDHIYTYFLDRNILLRPLGNIIYILPPYVITPEELQLIYYHIEEYVKGA